MCLRRVYERGRSIAQSIIAHRDAVGGEALSELICGPAAGGGVGEALEAGVVARVEGCARALLCGLGQGE